MGLDPLIAAVFERLEPLLEFKELAPRMQVQESTPAPMSASRQAHRHQAREKVVQPS
jgi:hypothetical protein